MSRLITASLIGAIDWLNKCPPAWKTRALEDLTNQLARIYEKEMPLRMKRGIDLETAVYVHAARHNDAGSEHFQWLVFECRGGVFQKKVKRFIELDGYEYCLYGKLDVWFPDVIKDVKTTGQYGGRQKYLDSFQHKLYCYIEQIPKFKYIIGEFQGDDEGKLIAHHEVEYEVKDWHTLHEEVLDKIRATMEFLKGDAKLLRLYATTFSRY